MVGDIPVEKNKRLELAEIADITPLQTNASTTIIDSWAPRAKGKVSKGHRLGARDYEALPMEAHVFS